MGRASPPIRRYSFEVGTETMTRLNHAPQRTAAEKSTLAQVTIFRAVLGLVVVLFESSGASDENTSCKLHGEDRSNDHN
jgi:hypothetical protein